MRQSIEDRRRQDKDAVSRLASMAAIGAALWGGFAGMPAFRWAAARPEARTSAMRRADEALILQRARAAMAPHNWRRPGHRPRGTRLEQYRAARA